jgi:hypothetical protein
VTHHSPAVATCVRGAKIETLDLWDELVRLIREEPVLYRALYHRYGSRQDGWGHITAAGNAFIAQQIAQRFASRGWRPPSIRDVSVKDRASDQQ